MKIHCILLFAITYFSQISLVFALEIKANQQDQLPQKNQDILQDMDSLSSLITEGGNLYNSDEEKKSAYKYCIKSGILSHRGEFRRAIREASKALYLGKTENNSDYVAHAMRDLAIAYDFAGNYQMANTYATLALKEKVSNKNKAAVHGWLYKILGDVAFKSGDIASAEEMYEKSFDISRDSLRFYSRISLSNALHATGKIKNAIDMIKSAESYLGILPVEENETGRNLLLRTEAKILIKSGKLNDAVLLLNEANKIFTSKNLDYESFQTYKLLAEASFALKNTDEEKKYLSVAIEISEKIRGKFYSEEIKSGLFGNMLNVYERLTNIFISEKNYEKAFEVSEKMRTRSLLDQIQGKVQHINILPNLQASLKFHDVKNTLPEHDVWISYFLSGDKLTIFSLRKSGLEGIVVTTSAADIRDNAKSFALSISEKNEDFQYLGKKLYDAIIKPALKNTDQRIIFIPYGYLHNTPLHATHTEKKFLIEEYEISYAPSAATLISILNNNTKKSGEIVAFGNPLITYADLPRLSGGEREVENIGKIFPKAEIHVRENASKKNFLEKARSGNVLHIAAHSQIDSIDPVYSKIYLSSDTAKTGILEAKEIYGLDLSKNGLITLSSCMSGYNKVANGDEIYGFTRSFLGAGSGSVIASLWPVADNATELLMTEMYSMSKSNDFRKSIQLAQIKLIKDKNFSHPYYWAAFELIGDWR